MNTLEQSQSSFDATAGLLSWQVYLLAWMAGVWSLREPQAALATAGVLWLGLVVLREGKPARALAALALMGVCFGLGLFQARSALPEPPATLHAALQGREKVTVQATVAAVADKPYGRIELLLEDVRVLSSGHALNSGNSTESLPGRVAWDWDEPVYRPAPGQTVQAQLRLRPVHGFRNPGGPDFEWQQRLRGVFTRAYSRGEVEGVAWGPRPTGTGVFGLTGADVSAWAWDAREALRSAVLQKLPDTQGGAIVLGLLLGDRSRIDQTTTEDLRAAGLAHTLALSGLNVVYVAVLGWALAWLTGLIWPGLYLRIPRQKLAIVLSLPLVAAYVWVGQGSPSLVRSAYMFGFWGALILFDRGRVLLDGLFLALACILLPAPLAVFDVGLQMSAIAVGGLALLFPWLRGLIAPAPVLVGKASPRTLVGRALVLAWSGLSMTLASNIALAPVSIWYFGVFPVNILLNLPWLPLQGLVVQILGMLGMALALVSPLEPLAGWLLHAAAWVQQGMLDALRQVAALGWLPVWTLLRPLWPEMLGAAVVFCLVPAYWRRPHAAPWALIVGGLLLMVVPHALMLRQDARDEVRLSVLDVGQSQAVLVSLPGGARILVDGGGTLSRTFDLGRSVLGPVLTWGRPPRLDAVFLSHPDADHAQGLAYILRQFQAGALYTNGQLPRGELGEEFSAAFAARGLAPEALVAGRSIALGDDVQMEVLHPAATFASRNSNENSLVLRLVWRGHPLALLPGDVQRTGIEDMVDAGRDLRAEVLLLPHHGSKSSYSGMLYDGVAPGQALVSCGPQNMYHFPNSAVVAELELRGIPLASTAESGMLNVLWPAPGAVLVLQTPFITPSPTPFDMFLGAR